MKRMGMVLAAMVMAACVGEAAWGQSKSRKDIPPPVEMTGTVRRTDVWELGNGDKMLQYNNPDRDDTAKGGKAANPTPSRIRMFLPGNVKEVKGIVLDLGYTYTPDSKALQAVCREEGWVMIGCLLRYKYGTELLDMALKDFAERTGHKELVTAPIILMGFSRNGSRAWDFAEENPGRTVALALGGNPGIPAGFGNAARVELAKGLPVLTVVGSKDPFVDYDKGEAKFWHNATYPKIREKEGVTWGMMIGWGYGHGWEGSWAPFVVFFQDSFAMRGKDGEGLKKVPFEEGYLAEYGWKKDWPEVAKVGEFKGDKTKAIWLASANEAFVWRAYQVENAWTSMKVNGEGKGMELGLESVPEGVTSVEYFERANSLGVVKAAPFVLKTEKLGDGVRTVYAVMTKGEGKSPTRPVTIAGGRALDWKSADADWKVAERAENVVRLTPEMRGVLKSVLAGEKVEEGKVVALKAALVELEKDPFVEQRGAAGKVLKMMAGGVTSK